MRQLQLPVKVNYEAIAMGILEMFDDDERTVLRFGMLPAKKMEVLENCVKEKFLEFCHLDLGDGNYRCYLQNCDVRYEDFNLKRMVSDAVHNICLEIYKIGDLVV